jgi:hypothetical protein
MVFWPSPENHPLFSSVISKAFKLDKHPQLTFHGGFFSIPPSMPDKL